MIFEQKYDDLIDLLCGEKIGYGLSRAVFECSLNPKWVVKIENDECHYQNIREYFIWNEIQYWKKMSKWFAPVHHLSPSGRVLIMEKTIPVRYSEIPDKVPAFFGDQKLDNYGLIDGQLVCHDYGVNAVTKGWSNRLKKHNFGKE